MRDFFAWSLIFYRQKLSLNNLRELEELVFFDLWIPDSGFWFPVPIPVSDSGFWIPVSGF